MILTNENVLLGSLLGSKAVQQIPRFAAFENEVAKHVTPPISILPFQNKPHSIHESDDYDEVSRWITDKAKPVNDQFFPLSLQTTKDENPWLLPWEPYIDIQSNVRLAERYIAKAGTNQIGSIKERWSLDDYDITISGAFYGPIMRGKPAETYPIKDMERLKKYLMSAEAIQVFCEPFQILGISRIAITNMSFPFTKGEYVQAYQIRAKSDFPYDLIYKRKKKPSLYVGDVIGGTDEKYK
ncbi:DUF6046 domain-containing protein [Chryseobacterium oncorhynchi]|uniref:DUF6046 domain-containing protein n=1 Tax=Chryseobacterium oncorhynchi TaxID=741074 RepID=A0A316WUQ3_9FLAO|nr:DUF6046 domain-containing protein [Chryseobacterium oncorhynchi]PWN62310.1 hypothetical protein C1638_017615 [Chryseobacterium oncorhynchi]